MAGPLASNQPTLRAVAPRLRIEYAGALLGYLNSPAAAKVWMLLPPPLETVGDLAEFLRRTRTHLQSSSSVEPSGANNGKKRKASSGSDISSLEQPLQLTIGGFVVPLDAPISILRDNDVVRVALVEEPAVDSAEGVASASKRRKGGESAASAAAVPAEAPTSAPAAAAAQPEEGIGDGAKRRRNNKKKRRRGKAAEAAESEQDAAAAPAPAAAETPQQQPMTAAAAGGSGKHVRFGEEQEAAEAIPVAPPEPQQQEPQQEQDQRARALAHVHPSRRSAFVQGQDGSWSSQGQPPKPPTIFLPRCLRVATPAAAPAPDAAVVAEEEEKAPVAAGSTDVDSSSSSSSSEEDSGSSSTSSSSSSSESESEAEEVQEQDEPSSYAGEYKRPYAVVAVAGEGGAASDDDAAAAAAAQEYPAFPSAAKPLPAVGDVLCYRVLAFSEETMTPELSGYKTGRVVEVRPGEGEVELAGLDGDDGEGKESLEWEALQEVRVKAGPTREFLDNPPPPEEEAGEGDVVLEGALEGAMDDLGALIQQKRLSLLSNGSATTPAKTAGGAEGNGAAAGSRGGRRRRRGKGARQSG